MKGKHVISVFWTWVGRITTSSLNHSSQIQLTLPLPIIEYNTKINAFPIFLLAIHLSKNMFPLPIIEYNTKLNVQFGTIHWKVYIIFNLFIDARDSGEGALSFAAHFKHVMTHLGSSLTEGNGCAWSWLGNSIVKSVKVSVNPSLLYYRTCKWHF